MNSLIHTQFGGGLDQSVDLAFRKPVMRLSYDRAASYRVFPQLTHQLRFQFRSTKISFSVMQGFPYLICCKDEVEG